MSARKADEFLTQMFAEWDAASDWLARYSAGVAAKALRDAAEDPRARLVGHSGVSVRWLRETADALAAPATPIGRADDGAGL